MKLNAEKRKKIIRFAGIFAAVLIAVFNLSPSMRSVRALPNAVFTEEARAKIITYDKSNYTHLNTVSVDLSENETLGDCHMTIRLFGLIKLKTIPVYSQGRPELHPCGNAIGLSIYTQGVLIVGNGSFINLTGDKCSPAADAGLKAGDVVLNVNGASVSTAEELQVALNASPAQAVIDIERNGRWMQFRLIPQIGQDGNARIGAWVRDSTVGIGTLSFIDTETNMATALGHAVMDADTGKIISVRTGQMVVADVIGVTKGRSGNPGELRGTFNSDNERIASITGNNEFGIFGIADGDGCEIWLESPMPLAFPNEVHKGEAYILSTIDGQGVESYSCKIVRATNQSKAEQKGIVVEITDERLLSETGGIVQGMSGSPIIQDGRIVGVVTHVFVNDPTRGYGIYAYWMYENMLSGRE